MRDLSYEMVESVESCKSCIFMKNTIEDFTNDGTFVDKYIGVFFRLPIKDLYIFHHNDLDGYTSAAVILYYYSKYILSSNQNDKTVHTIAVNYDMTLKDQIEISNIRSSEFWFVDYSFEGHENIDFLHYLYDSIPDRVVWIDHHESSVKIREKFNWMKNISGIIGDYKLAGCALTKIFLYYLMENDSVLSTLTSNNISEFISYASDWDTFAHHYKNCIYFNNGVFANFNEDIKPLMIDRNISDFWLRAIKPGSDSVFITSRYIQEGIHIEKYQSNLYKNMMKKSARIEISFNCKTYNCIACNGTGNSLVFGEDYNTADFCILFSYNLATMKYNYSFYSHDPDNFRACDICEALGGGGHPGAAGFSLSFNMFEGVNKVIVEEVIEKEAKNNG